MRNVTQINENAISGAIKVDEKEIQNHLSSLVRQSAEETLNGLLNAEADALCGASRYQRSPERQDTRAGSCSRKLMTRVGEVDLTIPRLLTLPFETQIIERCKRRECGVEEALVEMYPAGVSVRRVEDITEALWGGTVSDLNKKMVLLRNGAINPYRANILTFSRMASS